MKRSFDYRGISGIAVVGLIVLMLVFAGCGDDEDSVAASSKSPAAADWQAGGTKAWKRALEAGQAEGEVILDGPAEIVTSDFAKDFERDTGIQLTYAAGEGNERRVSVDQEVRANKLSVDISLGGGVETVTLLPDGLLRPIKPQLILPTVANPENWKGNHLQWIDTEKKYALQTSEYVWGWVVANTDEVESLDSWDDLLDPKYKGKIVSYDISAPGPGLSTAAFYREALGDDFVNALYEGQDVSYTANRRQLVEAVARGTKLIGIGGTQADIESFRSQGLPVNGLMPATGVGGLAGGSSVLTQPQNKDGSPGPHPAATTVFINWFLSPAGQEAYDRAMLEVSRRKDVKPPENVPGYVIPQPGREYIDLYTFEWWSKKYLEALEYFKSRQG